MKDLIQAELERPEAEWEPIANFPSLAGDVKFVSSKSNDQRLRLKFFRSRQDHSTVGKVWFGPEAAGPPGCAHGGSMAAVLDEIMGAAAWHAGYTVVAVRLTVNLRRLLPLNSICYFRTKIERKERRKVFLSSEIYNDVDGVFCDAEGVFVEIDLAKYFPALVKKPE